MIAWTREQDGEHNGKPCYEYKFAENGVSYSIVWAVGVGFGLSVYDHTNSERLHGNPIAWHRALFRCKEAAQKIYDARSTASCEAAS